MSADVPSRVTLRLDSETRAQLEERMSRTGMTISQTLRVVLSIGLRDLDASMEDTFYAAAFKEGVFKGAGAFKARVQEVMKTPIAED